MKLMAVKEDLNELDAEINSITLELDTNDDFEPEPEPIKEEINSKTVPTNANISKFRTVQKQISQRTPDINKRYTKKIPPKKISQTPDFNANSTLNIEDLMSSDEDMSDSNSKIITTPKKTSFRQSKISQDSRSQSSRKSIHRSPNNRSNYSCTSSISADEETNRLYMQSVKIVEKRTHSRFNNDPWFQYNDNDQDNISNSNNNSSESAAFMIQNNEYNNNEGFYFPKQSTFSYNYNKKIRYKPITEMDRINETQRKREKMALQRQQEKEREIEEECTFKPILSTRIPIISAEEEEKIRSKKQQRAEENISQTTSKIIRFIDPNSEKIANKAKMKPNSPRQVDRNSQDSPSPKVKYLSKKQIKKSCERLSKPKQILTNSDNENNDLEEEEDKLEQTKKKKKKFADPEAIERLFQNSTKNKKLNRNSDSNENENLSNLDETQTQKSPHSYMDSKSREIIEKSAKYRNSNDLFEDSIQVAEEKFRVSREIQKYNEMRDSDYSYRPKINQTSPHFTVNTTDYSTLIGSPTYSALHTPKSKKSYDDESQINQSSPLRKSFIVSPSPKKRKQNTILASESEIHKILDEVDAQIDSL